MNCLLSTKNRPGEFPTAISGSAHCVHFYSSVAPPRQIDQDEQERWHRRARRGIALLSWGDGGSNLVGMVATGHGARLLPLLLLLAAVLSGAQQARVGDTIGGIPVMGDGTALPRHNRAAGTFRLSICRC
jgi:hypothetical protein